MVLAQVAGMSPGEESESSEFSQVMDAGGSVKVAVEKPSAKVCNKLINSFLSLWLSKRFLLLYDCIRKIKMAEIPMKKKLKGGE